MGATKTEIFTIPQNSLAQAAKVLAHPARVAILQYISKQEGCICNDLGVMVVFYRPNRVPGLLLHTSLRLGFRRGSGRGWCHLPATLTDGLSSTRGTL